MRNLTKSASLLLLLSILASASACGGSAASGGDTAAPADTTPPETEPAYEFADVNLGGGEFHIVNTSTTWNFYNTIYFEEATGDTLDEVLDQIEACCNDMHAVRKRIRHRRAVMS